jgi:transcriptional regulator with XRE-family HTH domain
VSHFEQAGQRSDDAATRALRDAVTRKQVTLAALSAATGISRSTLGRRLRGRGDLTVTELVRLAVALDVVAADLLACAIETARVCGAGDTGTAVVETQADSGSPYSGGAS